MLVAACPNCGAELRFKSNRLPVRICDFCRSSVVRTDKVVQAMGKVATVPEDVSPLQIGTRGVHDERGFELVGRIRWRWADGAWNEWVMLFDDGVQGWLGEAMGRFMVLFEYEGRERQTKIFKRLMADEAIAPGDEITLDGTSYRVNDARQVDCVGSEGELPFSTPIGLVMRSIDLISTDGGCASVQKDRDEISVYRGRYVTLAQLRPTKLRAIEGWTMPVFAQ